MHYRWPSPGLVTKSISVGQCRSDLEIRACFCFASIFSPLHIPRAQREYLPAMTDPRTGSRWILGDKFEEVYSHLGSIENVSLTLFITCCHFSKDRPALIRASFSSGSKNGSFLVNEVYIPSTMANTQTSLQSSRLSSRKASTMAIPMPTQKNSFQLAWRL